MNTLMNTSLSMTSREIATLVESRHDNVKISIERLAERGIIQLPATQVSEIINGLGLTQKSEHYVFSGEQGKRDSIVVVAQLSPEFTARLVDRWQELEAQLIQPTAPALPLLPEQRAESIIGVFTRLAAAHGVPMSFAMQIASVEATKISGLPFDRLLTQAACMNAVPDEDVMLEPTELGKRYGISGQRLNSILGDHDLQMKIGDNWIPTEDGLKFSQRHAWSRGGKSGYNLKWLVPFIDDLMSAMAYENSNV